MKQQSCILRRCFGLSGGHIKANFGMNGQDKDVVLPLRRQVWAAGGHHKNHSIHQIPTQEFHT